MYSYKKSLKKEMIKSVKQLFNISADYRKVDSLMKDGVLDLQSTMITKADGIYRQCRCTNKITNQSTEFILKVNNK